MALSKIRLGDYIVRSTLNNNDLRYGTDLIVGVSNEGVFIQPKGDTTDVNLKPYKIVNNGAFVYNPTRFDLGSIAYRTEGLCIVSHLYMVFYLNDAGKKRIDPRYLYIYLRRKEFQREVTFRNFGSQRPEFSFNDISDIRMPLPDISIQRKYVDVYEAVVRNQVCYERGLNDLKAVCDALIKSLDDCEYRPISNYIDRNMEKNQEGQYTEADVRGFNNEGDFIEPMRFFQGDISTFKIIRKNCFVYNSRVNSTIKKLSIAFNEADDLLVTPAYESFYVQKTDELYPYYLYMLLQQERFARKVLFNSFGSATLFFDIDALGDLKIPVPDIEIQKSIAGIYKAYKVRRTINERLKVQIKDLCSILIKGSLEEAS